MADIRITADSSQAQGEIKKLNDGLNSIDKNALGAEKGLGSLGSTAKIAVGAFAALTAAVGVKELANYTTVWTDLNSRLVNATGSQQAAKQAMDAISASARTTYSSLEATADVFIRNSMALNELGYSTQEQIQVTEALNNAIAVSGARGDQAASALDAFAKSMARGKIDGEDFNRIIENAPRIVKALSDSLGVNTQQLRNMITEGRLTSDVVLPALIKQMGKLKTEADAMPATIADSFTVLNNKLLETVGRFDKVLGISTGVSKMITAVADNTGAMVGAIIGLTLAVGALLIPLIPAATAMAVLTGGAAVVGAVALSAALGYAAQKGLELSDSANKAAGATGSWGDAAEDLTSETNKQVIAAQRLFDEQSRLSLPLLTKLKLERESIGLLDTQLAIKKNLADAAVAIKGEEKDIVDKLRQRIIADTTITELAKQRFKIDFDSAALNRNNAALAIQDVAQRKIALELESQRSKYGEESFARHRGILEAQAKTNVYKEAERNIQTDLIKLGDEAYLLTIADLREREIKQQLLAKERELGSAFTEELSKQYETQLKINQALRDNEVIQQNIARYRTPQTGIMAATTVSGMLGQLDPVKQAQTQAETVFNGLEELRAQNKISEDEYRTMRVAAEVQANQQILDATRQRYETQKLMELQSQKNSIFGYQTQRAMAQEAAAFEMKTTFEKSQWAIQQGATVFAALGAQNRKAFEASKALNIATAIMNTYAGATKALATYPWPFGLIAAAAAVAAGMAQVAQIRSQSYSGRAVGGPVVGGQSYMVGEKGPEVFTPSTAGSITKNSDLQGGAPVNVNFTIYANDTSGFDELLTSRRGTIQTIISDAMLERGQR
jgi:tape measure domain-containing protein